MKWLSYPFTPLPFPSSSAPIHPNQNTWSSQSKHGFSSSCPVSGPAQFSFFSFDLGKDLACYKVRVFFAHGRCSFFVFTSGLSSFHPSHILRPALSQISFSKHPYSHCYPSRGDSLSTSSAALALVSRRSQFFDALFNCGVLGCDFRRLWIHPLHIAIPQLPSQNTLALALISYLSAI